MSKNNSSPSILAFFVGLILLAAGLYMISNKVMITSSFGFLSIGAFSIPFGLTTIPLIIGIVWMFVQPDKIAPKIVIVLGAVFIVSAIIMGVRFYFVGTTLYEYILMFGLTAAGSGLLLRTLFASNEKTKSKK